MRWLHRARAALLPLAPPFVALALQGMAWERFIPPHVWFLLFYPAIVASAWLGSKRQGLGATLLCAAMVWWFFIPPVHALAKDWRAVIACAAFVTTGVLIVLLTERVRQSARGLQQARDDARAVGARLESLLAQAPDGVFAADLEGRYTDVNEAGCRMLGYRRDELIGKTIFDLIPRDEADRLMRSKEKLLVGRSEVSEWLLTRKDGSTVPVEVNAWIMADGRWQSFARDISERKQLEASLAETAADLNRAQFVAEVGSWRLDVLRNDLSWSNECYRIFGIAPGTKMTYEAFLACVHPDDRAYVEECWTAALGGEPYDIEHRLLVDGVIKWVREKADLWWDEQGALVGGLGITQDVTARKRLEEQLHLAIQGRDELLAIVAHDLRSPLHSIVLQAGLMRRRGPAPERRTQRPIERIERAATQMSHLIQDLLEIARIDAGVFAMEPERLSAAHVLAEVMDAHEAHASDVHVGMRLELPEDLPDVWVDCDLFVRVFENLLANALKFTSAGGSVSVGATPTERDVLLWVADSGVGIPAEQLPHIFDRFWQAREARKGGAGLGLPFVKGVVEAHGGRIWCESTPGRGSTFFFTLPRASSVAAVAPQQSAGA